MQKILLVYVQLGDPFAKLSQFLTIEEFEFEV